MGRRRPLALALLLAIPGVTPARARGAEIKEFTYKTTKEGDLKAYVHVPDGWEAKDRRPAIVFFFGGGWENGRVGQFERQAGHLAGLGMVAVRADYRIKSRHGVTPDKCVEDAKSAVRWIRKDARTLGVDPDRIVAAGGSAGGHIAACTATTDGPESEGEDLSISSKPDAMVLFNPVLRFAGEPRLTGRLGGDEAMARRISPTLHVSKDTPPALLLYGSEDRLLGQGEEFVEEAKKQGRRAELFTAEGVGHGFFNRPPWDERTLGPMDEFLASLGYIRAPGREPGSRDREPARTTPGGSTR